MTTFFDAMGLTVDTADPWSSENRWWALGRHYGLATPLLDWTESPFVALYFAFEQGEKSTTGFRSVWALTNVSGTNQKIMEAHTGPRSGTDPAALEPAPR